MSWTIRIPYRELDQPLLGIDHSELAALDFGEREIARHIIAALAFERGLTTVGQAFDHLEAIGDAGRRALLDQARQAEGWPATTAVDEAERQKAAASVTIHPARGPMRDGQGRPVQCCPECGAFPQDQHGAIVGSNARQWWCERHREGHEEDLQDRAPGRIVAQPGGAFAFEGELLEQAERGKREDAFRREDFERRQQEAAAEAEIVRRAEERSREQWASDPFVNPMLNSPGWSGKA